MVRGPKTLESSFGHDSNPSALKLGVSMNSTDSDCESCVKQRQ
jgi:hypothetical protein